MSEQPAVREILGYACAGPERINRLDVVASEHVNPGSIREAYIVICYDPDKMIEHSFSTWLVNWENDRWHAVGEHCGMSLRAAWIDMKTRS